MRFCEGHEGLSTMWDFSQHLVNFMYPSRLNLVCVKNKSSCQGFIHDVVLFGDFEIVADGGKIFFLGLGVFPSKF